MVNTIEPVENVKSLMKGEMQDDAASLSSLMTIMLDQIDSLKEDLQEPGLKGHPELRSQISGRIITACKEVGTIYQRYLEAKKNNPQVASTQIVRHATLLELFEQMKQVVAEVEMPAEVSNLFFQTLTTKLIDFEAAVDKRIAIMKKEQGLDRKV